MTIDDLIKAQRAKIAAKLAERQKHTDNIERVRALCLAESRDPSEVEANEVRAAADARATVDTETAALNEGVVELEREKAADIEAVRLSNEVHRTGTERPSYDRVSRVGAEKRTYNPESDRSGASFLRDIGLQHLGDFGARERISRHAQEELVERGSDFTERAAGTGAFAGLTVPQYLTDMYAPNAKANRPFADACNHHDLPADGMTVNLSLITTGTSTAVQASENAAVSETNIDDTLLTIPVQTIAGQQTLSRQAIERGTGVEGAMLDDLFRAYATTLDSILINQAVTGLSAAAVTTASYADATPTVAELYPKFLQALSLVEAALLDQDPGDNIAVMHSRRWYWLQNAVGATWPFAQQPQIGLQMGITNLAERYGNGIRGVLPNGTPVIVDNNVPVTKGGGTEDEIYVVSQRECHLWEDPGAPMMIRAEQPALASLGVLFVVYGYAAYTFARYPTAPQKISGTGLIAPSFTGV